MNFLRWSLRSFSSSVMGQTGKMIFGAAIHEWYQILQNETTLNKMQSILEVQYFGISNTCTIFTLLSLKI